MSQRTIGTSRDERAERRHLLRALACAASAALWLACSSGLEGLDGSGTTDIDEPPASTNLRFAFELDAPLTQPVTDVQAAGGVIPTAEGARERPVAFFAFVTAGALTDADDLTIDSNGVEDVFVAAVDTTRIDTRAFSYAIASTMRHPRCVTCHQMNVDVVADPTALPPLPFLTQAHFDGANGGKPPLNKFDDEDCKGCHFPDWLAPGPTFDLRREGTRDLFLRAQVPPGGLEVHFRTDARVLWALDRADTPFGNAADDDHDGIDEPEDHDGVRRHAPGGKEAFLRHLDDWLETEDPVTGELKFSSAKEAVQDIVVASQTTFGNQAGNGASRAPSLVYVPNPGFDPDQPTVAAAGTLHVAFESGATDFSGGGGNAFVDVYRATIDVFLLPDGEIDLRYRGGSQVHVSAAAGGGDASGDSTDPDIGADGARIAYVSSAFDLVAGLPTTCRPEVYLWDELAGNALVSHVPGDPTQPGNAGSIGADLSLDGNAVAFESDASDLAPGDTNGTRDVFYALWPGLGIERASVADGGGELTTHSHSGSLFHEAGNVKVAFASQDAPLPPVSAVQCPDEVVVLTSVRDTHIREGRDSTHENNNFGPNDLNVGTTGASAGNFGQGRGLVAFDLSSIPAGATINSATLTMRVNDVPDGTGAGCTGPVPADVTLHVLTQDWVENQATWMIRSTGVPWSAPGANGDFSASSSALTVLDSVGTYQWSSAQMAADVQSWLDAGNNFGWLLQGGTLDCTVKKMDGREFAQPPRLTVDYTPPILRDVPPGGAVASTVMLRDTALGRTVDLHRIVDPAGTVEARALDVDGSPLAANATNPVISPDGNAVLFESTAQNVDRVRPHDENRLMDVVLVDLLELADQGFVLPYAVSVTADGGNANGPSHSPRFGAFNPPTDSFPLGIAVFATQATNLGNADPGDINNDGVPEFDNFMAAFLSEGGSVLADFEAEPARAGKDRGVRFVSRSSGEPEDFLWDFGDSGATSTEESPTHAYATPGLYTVKLTVSGELGDDERTRIEYVHVLDAVTATFSSTKDTSRAPLQAPATDVPFATPVAGAIDDADPDSALLFDLSSAGSTEFPDEFSWSLTRVTPAGAKKEVSVDENPQDVVIDAPGSYDLTLEATGPGGAGTATQRIDVFQKVTAAFTTNPSGAIVRGPASLAVQFQDASLGDLSDSGAHEWDFGDGTGSTEANPTHSFAEGIYFVNLTVAGKGTDSDISVNVPVIADGTITAAFALSPRPAGSLAGLITGEAIDDGTGVLVDFDNLSQHQLGSPLFFRWNFGAGGLTGQETAENPTGILYTLPDPEHTNVFFPTLVTSTVDPPPFTCFLQPAGTCSERFGALIVFPRPSAAVAPPGPSFASSPLRPPHTVQLNGTVIGDGIGTNPTYRWLRSEANATGATIPFAFELNPVYEFDDPGVYEVVLEVETDGPGDSRQTAQSLPVPVVVTASTLTEWYMQAVDPVSGAICTNCHSGANPAAGLNWLGTPAEIFQRIVEDAGGEPVFSRRCNTARRLIQPFDPENSAVYNVLLRPPGPLCSINMRINLAGSETDKDAHVAKLRSWIGGGALND